jgi:hypothetical protein
MLPAGYRVMGLLYKEYIGKKYWTSINAYDAGKA